MSWICGIMIAFDIVIWEQMVTGPEKKQTKAIKKQAGVHTVKRY